MSTRIGFAVAAIACLAQAGSALATGSLDVFTLALESPVSDGVPGPGAGNIERAGSVDQYDLTVTAGTQVYFDEISGSCNLRWSCEAPSGAMVFTGNVICSADPGAFTIAETGTYTITVFAGNGTATGTYSFTIWEIDPPDVFAIGLKQVVSDGNPGPGAGNVEEPGATDVYTFTGSIGDDVYFDELSGGCGIRWFCKAPSGAMLFDDTAMCVTDPGTSTLGESGTYTITVFGALDATGTYSFIR